MSYYDRTGKPKPKVYMKKRDFSQERRDKLADKGAAMPDGSFPIVNGGDLDNAIKLVGRAKDPEAAKAHIKTRAKALGLESKLPPDWVQKAGTAEGAKLAVATRRAGPMPLKGHEYHTMTDEQLRFAAHDAGESARRMRGYNAQEQAKYLDQRHDAHTVLSYRGRGGIPVAKKSEPLDGLFPKITKR